MAGSYVNEKLKAYRALCAESPNDDPVKLAALAGYANPKEAVERLRTAEARAQERAQQEAEDAAQGITPDRSKALRTLRTLANKTAAPASARVAAAKALLESEPKPLTSNNQILVCFRGRETDQHQRLLADVDPTALAAAIEHVKQEREAAHERQIRDYAAKHALDEGELQLAWELWQHQEARAAGLRILVLSDGYAPSEFQTDNLDNPPQSERVHATPIHTSQGEQSVALESDVRRISTDSLVTP